MHSSQRLETITRQFAQSRTQRSASEIKLREELAAAYRIANLLQWDELTFNHISVRLDDDGSGVHKFLINPYGLGFDEVTASSLVTVDAHGTIIDPGNASGKINPAGFVIHSAVHEARPDARCVLHTHHPDVTAVACRKEGFLPLTQTHLLLGEVTYHDFQGLALNMEERESLAKDLGKDSSVMLLKNHGCLTLGTTVGDAVVRHFLLVRACQTQLKAMADGRLNGLSLPSETALDNVRTQMRFITSSSSASSAGSSSEKGLFDDAFRSMVRSMERKVGSAWKE